MQNVEAERGLDQLVAIATEVVAIAKTAHRNRKTLHGDNHYGQKFHNQVVKLSAHVAKLLPTLRGLGLDPSEFADLETHLLVLKLPSSTVTQRSSAVKEVKLLTESVIKPRFQALTANPVPVTEQVLPFAVVKQTRTYLEKIVTQGNGCYEHQWFDACSVMIRRLVETLIIELYEAKAKASDIKDANGDYLMLSRLIDKTLADKSWSLNRESKRTLPLVKTLGDRSAHNRRYVATKKDVDNVIPGLRVLADDLLHLAGLK
jgi:hypothetical protein